MLVTHVEQKKELSHLEIFSCPQEEETSRQHLLLQTDILQKQSLGAPEIQSNPAILNLVNSKPLLFRRKIEFPWIYPDVFSHLLSAISNSVILNSLLFRTHRSFPTPKINPVISNLSKTEYVHKSTAGNVLHFI